MPTPAQPRAFHVMAKPIGPICNLDCQYCFYLEKEHLYPAVERWKMPDDVLEAYIRQLIQQQDVPQISFAWQGGEPTLLGVDFFRRVVQLQQQYAAGKQITNALQTNATLLDDAWCAFLAEQKFLVGVSIDGPPALHDRYRLDKRQQPTSAAVLRGIALLKKHGAEFNTLTVVHRHNAQKPLEVYEYLRQIGSGFIQFIPLVEREMPVELKVNGLSLAEPPAPGLPIAATVTPWSVQPAQYGQFLSAIFDQWVRRDVGRTFVQLFDAALGQWLGASASLCVFAENCGTALALEHNGDVFACDHYVYPRYRLGNLLTATLADMVYSDPQRQFGHDKSATLPAYCRKCPVLFACHGECPKHRFATTPDGQPGLNYLCPAYKQFFTHVDPYMKTMAKLLSLRQAPAQIMTMLAEDKPDRSRRTAAPGRNDPCPCGSGRKFKVCCGRVGK